MKGYLISGLLLFTFCFNIQAGEGRRLSRSEYISKYKDDAIRDMQKTGVPASITIGQACLESDDGNSALAKEANNHFGIKCAEWKGPYYTQDDDHRNECFRKYNDVLESYDDHSSFLKTRPRYSALFQYEITDYKSWAHGLKKAGYATDPHYAKRLIQIIEENQLYLLDKPGEYPLTATTNSETLPTEEAPKEEIHRVYVPSVEAVDAFAPRKVRQVNGIDCIIVRKGDTFKSLAKEFELGYWQLPKYNELDGDTRLADGQIIFLKPKKKTGAKDVYIVKDGDTVYSISQEMGIKTKYLRDYNKLQEAQELQPGQKIVMKKKS